MNRKEAKNLITEQVPSDINRTRLVVRNSGSGTYIPTEIVIETVKQHYGSTTTRTYFIATPVFINEKAEVCYGEPTKIDAASVSESCTLSMKINHAEKARDRKSSFTGRLNTLLNVNETAGYYDRQLAGANLADRVVDALGIDKTISAKFNDANRFGEDANVTLTLTLAQMEALFNMTVGA